MLDWFGSQNMTGRLRRVMVRPPGDSFCVDSPEIWNYAGKPDLGRAREEHRGLVRVLVEAEVEVVENRRALPGFADSIFVFDPLLITRRGAIQLRMGKELRRGEERALAQEVEKAGIPILGELTGEACAEGGDCLWLDEKTLVVGRGFRTNALGIEQIKEFLSPLGIEVIAVDLPFFKGPRACLHLLSLLSLLRPDLAVVFPYLVPVRLWELLKQRRIVNIEVPEEEFLTLGTNVLSLGQGRCLALEGNPITRKRMEDAGCRVYSYRGQELSLKAEGGPTCLTLPLLRDPE